VIIRSKNATRRLEELRSFSGVFDTT